MRLVLAVPVWTVIGCGDGIDPGGGAPAPAARVEVTVRVADDADAGIPGAQVYAQTPDDLVDGSAVTGSDGSTSLEVSDGGTVTVVDGDDVTTFVGVKAGDVLVAPHRGVLSDVTVPLGGALPSSVDAMWTTCGSQVGPLVDSAVFPRCADSVDVMFEHVEVAQGSVQTLANVDTATIDVSQGLVAEVVETVTVHGDVDVVQWLVTPRGRLKYAYPPFGLPFQFPDLPDATIKTIAISGATGTFVVDGGPLMATYDLDVGDDIPAVGKGYREVGSLLHWIDDGSQPADVAVVTADAWTLVAPITYGDGEASVRLPAVATFGSIPTVSFLRTYRFGGGYDAVRGHAAEYDEAFVADLSPIQFGQLVATSRMTPPQRFVVQLIQSCLVTACR